MRAAHWCLCAMRCCPFCMLAGWPEAWRQKGGVGKHAHAPGQGFWKSARTWKLLKTRDLPRGLWLVITAQSEIEGEIWWQIGPAPSPGGSGRSGCDMVAEAVS